MKSRTAPARVAQGAKVLVLAANGSANTQISARAGVAVSTVCAWRERFGQEGLAKFWVGAPGPRAQAVDPS